MAHIILWNSLADAGGARALGPYQLVKTQWICR
jgi:hypothetical protein